MRLSVLTLSLVALVAAPLRADDWAPKKAPLMTRWADDVSPENVLPEYPRPQLERERWKNLNGLWDYAIQPKAESKPKDWDGKILVPFCAESALSGVMKRVGGENKLWYQRSFVVPSDWQKWNVLLHFGAVDWQTTVWVNGKKIGQHEGGYDPFTFDITDALKKGSENTIVVSVWDPTDQGPQPAGKQVKNPGGIYYTPVTGIWQTVWLEPVSNGGYVKSLKIVPDVDNESVRLTANCGGVANGSRIQVSVIDPKTNAVVGEKRGRPGQELVVPIDGEVKLWSPKHPFLYDLRVSVVASDNSAFHYDEVQSYVGMRKIEVKQAKDGYQRLFLNGKPLFQFGPLDQGWWPDGLYTAPTDEALKYDIEITKKLGFNMARKHVKVEPARWYYWCDKLGLLVWQDMPNGDKHIGRDDPDITRTPESEAIYRKEWKQIIKATWNHPCIVVWVPFNEGWGQFKTDEIIAWTQELDPSRLVDGPSGWSDRDSGDMIDMHMYPGPGMFPPEDDRATVLGEFGGLGWPVEGHLWQTQDVWGYRTYETQEELVKHYNNLIRQLPALIGQGLAAAIYTQTTDVETEVNGVMTYDRAVIKLPVEETRKLNSIVYEPPPKTVSVIPTSQKQAQTWHYTTKKPAKGWRMANFDASKWKTGKGGFGTKGTPNTQIGTTWNTPDIWLRRMIELPEDLHSPALQVHHDEKVRIFLNGKEITSRRGYTTDYGLVPLSEEAQSAFKPGKNVLAVHCHQTGGGQYIDVGVVDLVPAK